MSRSAVHPSLADAIIIATHAHRFQVDKNGEDYILHPLRVMLRGKTEVERIVRVLHDTLEDTDVDLDMLRAFGFSDEILEALWFITKRPEEEDDYEAFIERIRKGPVLAIKAKLDDLADNTDPNRATKDDEETRRRRREKYMRAIDVLSEELRRREQ